MQESAVTASLREDLERPSYTSRPSPSTTTLSEFDTPLSALAHELNSVDLSMSREMVEVLLLQTLRVEHTLEEEDLGSSLSVIKCE